MGRFYKTTKGQFLDFMSQLPKEEMLQGIDLVDAQVGEVEKGLQEEEANLKLDSVDYDTPEARKILKGHMDRIDAEARNLHKNPLAYRRRTPQINQIGRDIKEDFAYGDASKVQAAYDTRKANAESMAKMMEKNPDDYSYEDIQKLQAVMDREYGDPEQGGQGGYKGGKYGTKQLVGFEDINDFDKFGKDWKAEISETLGAFKGEDGFLYTSKNYDKRVEEVDIETAIKEMLDSDMKLNKFYDQQTGDLGNLSKAEYEQLKTDTARRIGEKYGFVDHREGITSMRRDTMDTTLAGIREQHNLNNPGNTSPGNVKYNSTLYKYQQKDDAGNPIPNKSVDGINTAVKTIDSMTSDITSTAVALAKKNNIVLDFATLKELENGNFNVLEGLEGTDGTSIGTNLLSNLKQQYKDLAYDKRLLTASKNIANKTTDPDAYLAENKEEEIILNNINEYQSSGIVAPKDFALFNKQIAGYQEEIKNGVTWRGAEGITYDTEDIKNLPEQWQIALRRGDNPNQMVADGLVRSKKVKIGEEPERYQDIQVLEDPSTANDWIPWNEKKVTKSIPIGSKDVFTDTNEYLNFEVKKHAKPSTALDADGNVIIQGQMVIEGIGVDFYLPEKALSNRSIKGAMDMDMMKAYNLYQRAIAQGVINSEGFNIEGLTFTRTGNETTVKLGNKEVGYQEGLRAIALKLKAERTKQ